MIELVFILDESGSMRGLEKDTIGGFNSTIEKQKKEDGTWNINTKCESQPLMPACESTTQIMARALTMVIWVERLFCVEGGVAVVILFSDCKSTFIMIKYYRLLNIK